MLLKSNIIKYMLLFYLKPTGEEVNLKRGVWVGVQGWVCKRVLSDYAAHPVAHRW